jgi:hypothetical protein
MVQVLCRVMHRYVHTSHVTERLLNPVLSSHYVLISLLDGVVGVCAGGYIIKSLLIPVRRGEIGPLTRQIQLAAWVEIIIPLQHMSFS